MYTIDDKNYHVLIEKVNETNMFIHCDEDTKELLYYSMQLKDPDHKPGKFSKWDGVERHFEKRKKGGVIATGLLDDVLRFLKSKGLTYGLDDKLKHFNNEITMENIRGWCNSIDIRDEKNNPIKAYEYQIKMLYTAIKYKRSLMIAATSAGKSLAISMMIRYMVSNMGTKKILIIVPSVNLVNQMYDNINEYFGDIWSADVYTHKIKAGTDKDAGVPVYISTWQSIQDQPKEYFEQFDVVIRDEVHGSDSAKSMRIMRYCINASYRIGMTGTLKNKTPFYNLKVKKYFGPVCQIISSKEIRDMGMATDTEINMISLNYQPRDRIRLQNFNFDMEIEENYPARYPQEIDFICDHLDRAKFINDLAMGMPKGENTLIMFSFVDKHLIPAFEEFLKKRSNVYCIHGKVSSKIRDEIKSKVEAGEDIILLATYGSMAVGISIKKLHNLILAGPIKSFSRVIQTIGRMLRLHESKDISRIYDIVDNLCIYGEFQNYAIKHALTRHEHYVDEVHTVKHKTVNL